ncbi:translation initiation factor IF-2-like isoform X2 [Cricetulus griseus]|uniref:Translation initiation factor IF-2-like isoform X2 n=1 Tax=Cricetulus griseus TaxID=10029 RepID=A0A9J7JS47_CRIGR|nr:translation initiation factor IF-2-like isoform X2 [Cricetulus griseus]
MGAASGTPSPGCNGSRRRGVRRGAAFARRLGPSGDLGAPSPAAASTARSPPLPPPSARPSEPRRPGAPPAGLGSAFPLLGASCEPNIALPSHVDRSGLGGGRTGLRDAGGGGAGTGSPPRERGSAGTAREAREELPGGLKLAGSTPGTRRWACAERTWLAVPRRSLVGCAVERGGDPPCRATSSSKGVGLEKQTTACDPGSFGLGSGQPNRMSCLPTMSERTGI